MKAVLLSVQPNWCAKIFNAIGHNENFSLIYEKNVEIRKTRPKINTPFKVYIYCTKGEPVLKTINNSIFIDKSYKDGDNLYGLYEHVNGKVIGEFVCNKIDEYQAEFTDLKYFNSLNKNVCLNSVKKVAWREDDNEPHYIYETSNEEENPNDCKLLNDSCLTFDELRKYIGKTFYDKSFYGYHISNRVVYDKPRELSGFFYACDKPNGTDCSICIDRRENKCKAITRPPQSWCYVEGGNANAD